MVHNSVFLDGISFASDDRFSGKSRLRPSHGAKDENEQSAGLHGRSRQPRSKKAPLELHSLIDLSHCQKSGDKGVYYGNELVGAVARMGDQWTVWKIKDYGQPLDRANLAMYEEDLERMCDFKSLQEARKYIRGPFCEMILKELESRKR
jgi:hypothetical protein